MSYSLTPNKRTPISNVVSNLLESLGQSQYLDVDIWSHIFEFSCQPHPNDSILLKALQYSMTPVSHLENCIQQCHIWIWSIAGPKIFLSSQFLNCSFYKCGLLNLFIYCWLCWVFVSVRGFSLVAASGGHSSSRCAGLSLSRPLPLRSTGSRRAGSVVVAHKA